MSNKITVTKPAALGFTPGIHSIDCTSYRRRLAAAGSWNFTPLTEEQIEKARIDFIRRCAEVKQDAKISEALNEAVQAPMDQAAMTAAVEMMKIEIKDGKVKVPTLEPERSNVFKKPGVDEPIEVEMKYTYQHTPFITAALLRDRKAEMADCKLNGVMVKNMTLAEFQAVWTQQIEEQEQREKLVSPDNLTFRIRVDNDVFEARTAQMNPCAEIVLGEPEPDVLTSAVAEIVEKQKQIEENLAKLKAGQTLNESERVTMEQHLDEFRLRLKLKEKENRLANEARHAKYQEFMATVAQERSHELRQRQIIVDEIENFTAAIQDIRPKGEPIKPQKVWVDTEADYVIVKKATTQAVSQAEDRIHRHMEAYDGPKGNALVYGSKQPCPDCGGSGEYVGFNHTETCPSCKGSKVA